MKNFMSRNVAQCYRTKNDVNYAICNFRYECWWKKLNKSLYFYHVLTIQYSHTD